MTLPLPPADGDRAEAAGAPLRSAALVITDLVVEVAGEIDRPALAVGEAAAEAEDGAVAAAALAEAVSAGAVVSVGADSAGDMSRILSGVQPKAWPSTTK